MPSPSPAAQLAAAQALDHARYLLLDMDGTLIRQHEVMAGTQALLTRFQDRFCVVSNNSTHTPAALSLRLKRMGLVVPPQRIVLAGVAAVQQVRARFPAARILFIGSPSLRRYALMQGCALVDHEADLVLLALDKRFGYAKLSLAINTLRRGATWVVANTDLTHPGPQGQAVPETGTLLAALQAASGVTPSLRIGKPEALLFEQGLQCLGAHAHEVLMIGDNPDTDGAGAARAGIAFVQVGEAPGAAAPTLEPLLRQLPARAKRSPAARRAAQ